MATYLLDTNILTRAADSAALQHRVAVEAIVLLRRANHSLSICPQNVIEFWAVATRPVDANGLGWSRGTASRARARMLRVFRLVHDDHRVFERWIDLVDRYPISGKRVHDARLVAVMLANGIDRLLTFNTEDFATFSEITAVRPEDVTP